MDLREVNISKRLSFIGHAGVGARVELLKSRNIWVLRETTHSQLFKIFLLGLIGFYPIYLLLFQYDKLNKEIGETFVVVVMLGTGIIGILFFFKFLIQLVQNRRIEINVATKLVSFFENKWKTDRKINWMQIQDILLEENDYISEGNKTKNYSITFVLQGDEKVTLLTIDDKKSCESIYNQIKTL